MDVERGGRLTARKRGEQERVPLKDQYTLTFSSLGLTVDHVSFLSGLSFVIISLTTQRALEAMGFLLCRPLPYRATTKEHYTLVYSIPSKSVRYLLANS